ncbi:7395_t:CDS:1 [Ambispora gerdemannii]|uniref:7395_t:CDS:1 n=1 Tax=Ambispora gerdemannii TaxID=144530 RepID=A0A9N8UZ36_9GLOM|nr:7395_t:CDS:1 [Ambispora gerdemannii]
MIAQEINNFVEALKKVIHLMSVKFYEEFLINENFEVGIEMTFHKCDPLRLYIFAPPAGIKSTIQKIMEPFERVGYLLFESSFGPDIGRYISSTMNGVVWELKEQVKNYDSNCTIKLYELRISLVDTLEHDDIISNTCLGETELPFSSKSNLVQTKIQLC